jgi:hypothetical protein
LKDVVLYAGLLSQAHEEGLAKVRTSILQIPTEENGRARELDLEVRELAPQEVRQAVVGNPKATKIDVAEALVRQGFGELKELIPKRPARAALGLRPKDKYWLHMFDALALATSAPQPHGN